MAQRIAVVGTGYVGLLQAVGLADFGNYVTGLDLREDVVERLSRGEPTIFEHGLSDYLERNVRSDRLRFTTNPAHALADAQIVFIAVGTPEAEDGSADLSQIRSVVADIATHCTGFTVVVTKSTVPVGTNRWIAGELDAATTTADDREFAVVSNPEFLREGRAVQDFFHPDRIVIGFSDPDSSGAARARELLEDAYRPLYLISTPFVWTNLETAELIKYASNAFLATKITFINQMANLAEATGADIHLIAKSMGMDGRISAKFLHPGPGYGGSCFPKDTRAIAATGDQYGVDMSVIKEVIRANESQKIVTVGKLVRLMGGSPAGRTVAVLGLAFKAETDDVRESPALEIVRELLVEGAIVRAYDPEAIDNFRTALLGEGPFGGKPDPARRDRIAAAAEERMHYCTGEFEALDGADAAIIVTEWNNFRNLDLDRAATVMSGRVLFDARNVLDPDAAKEHGFTYAGVGR